MSGDCRSALCIAGVVDSRAQWRFGKFAVGLQMAVKINYEHCYGWNSATNRINPATAISWHSSCENLQRMKYHDTIDVDRKWQIGLCTI